MATRSESGSFRAVVSTALSCCHWSRSRSITGMAIPRRARHVSQTLALSQSRFTVAGEISRCAAVSAMDSPPKYRSSTTCAWRSSSAASDVSASSRAMTLLLCRTGWPTRRHRPARQTSYRHHVCPPAAAWRNRPAPTPHAACRNPEEMAPVLPGHFLLFDEAEIRLFQPGHLQGVVLPLAPHVADGDLLQFCVYERYELVPLSGWPAPGSEEARNLRPRGRAQPCGVLWRASERQLIHGWPRDEPVRGALSACLVRGSRYYRLDPNTSPSPTPPCPPE